MALNIALLLFAIITWGYSWVLMKIGIQFMEPFTFATWRCAVGAAAMIPLMLIKGAHRPKAGKWADYTIVGLFQTTGLFALILFGMQFVTAGKTAVLLYTMPFWTSLLAHFYLKQRLVGSRFIGVISGAIGIVCILGWDTLTHQNPTVIFGESLVILAAISWAVANIWMKTRMVGEDPYTVNGLQIMIGTVFLAILAVSTGHGLFAVEWTPMSIFAVVFTGVVATAIDFTIWFFILGRLDTHTAAFSVMLVPVLGLFFDWLQLGTPIDFGVVSGGILILYGVYKVSKY